MTFSAPANPPAGTGFGCKSTFSELATIVTGWSPLLSTRHVTVVSPAAGSHAAFAEYPMIDSNGKGASVVDAATVVAAASVVGAAVVGPAVVAGRVAGT